MYMRINLWIPDKELKRIDAYCKGLGLTRSEFLTNSALGMIKDLEHPQIEPMPSTQRIPPNDERFLEPPRKLEPIKTLDEKIDSEAKRVIKEVKKKQEVKDVSGVCKHGRMKGLCEYGCK